MKIVRYKTTRGNEVLEGIRARAFQMNPDIVARVSEICEAVRTGGDSALIELTRRLDGVELRPDELRVAPEVIEGSAAQADQRVLAAFRRAIANVTRFHQRQAEGGFRLTMEDGARVGQRVVAVGSAGVYVPGGRALYPSSLIMSAVPARVAGVKRLVMTSPPGTVARSAILAALIRELGIEEVYQVGGAQAIAALAFGTETIPRVDKIVGPGSIWVATAKKLVYGAVGIDSIAGPTEVVVLADSTADPMFVAADLLAQAEHDEEAAAICITDSEEIANQVSEQIAAQLESLDRRAVAEASIERYGAVFVVESIEQGCDLVNLIAPEHLELMTSANARLAGLIKNAGALFAGPWSPEPVGDYMAGPSHVLPTVGTSRFASALGVHDFVRRQSVIQYSRRALMNQAEAIGLMAEAEGLTAHKRAVESRFTARETPSDPRVSTQISGLRERVGGLRQRMAELRTRLATGELPDEEGAALLVSLQSQLGELAGNVVDLASNIESESAAPPTFDPLDRIKPAVRAIRAYTLKPYRGRIKINQNENPFDVPGEIKQEVRRRLDLRPWSRYPGFSPAELIGTLATFAGWVPEGTLAGNGSNELIQATLMVTVGPGTRALICEPTFTLYRQIATVLGGEVVSVPLTEELQFDYDAIDRAIDEQRPDVVIICSPNNPTGCRFDTARLRRMASDFSGLIVVDEAYHEFSGRTVVPLLKELDNLVVLRTFSKAMALAGLRVGYLLTSTDLAREIHKATLPYSLNFFSATAAQVACEKFELLKPRIDLIVSERERLFAGLNTIEGVSAVESSANFLLMRLRREPKEVFEALLERDILVRDVSAYPMLSDCLRTSVGLSEENDMLLGALREIMAARVA